MASHDDTCWLLLAPEEVGLLHRLRPAVRATDRTVLVHLEQPPPAPGAQLGVVAEGRLTWFGSGPLATGLSATDVGTVVDLVQSGNVTGLVESLQHRAIASTTVRFSDRRASPRT